MKAKAMWIASITAVVVIFHICYGLEVLLPGNISWLMTVLHDWGQHYLGWQFYKSEPWQFPIGQVSNLYYPIGTNVGFTDSIPLLAIFFKIFAPLLPNDFQYFGFWLFACHLLAAYYTILICRLFKVDIFFTFLAVIFIAANPVLVYRGMHPALCSHWLLLGSIYIYFSNSEGLKARKLLIHQLILLIIAALVNPYICFMVLGFSFATATKLCFFNKVISKKQFLLNITGTILILLLVWYFVGMINFSKKEDLGVQGGFGLYGMNLNSFYNAGGFSTFLPAFKQVSWHQYEGFMYMGVGIFLLAVILLAYGLFIFHKNRRTRQHLLKFSDKKIYFAPLIVLLVLYTLFAVTHIVTFNDNILFKIPIPEIIIKLGEIFRASARFFWAPYYVFLFFILITVAKSRVPYATRSFILLGALCIQLYDIKLLLTHLQLSRGAYHPPINTPKWNSIIKEFDDIAFVPPFQATNLTHMDYQYFCFMAAKAQKPINTGYVARADYNASKKYTDSLLERLAEGKLSPRTLYITTASHLNEFSFPLQTDSCQLNILDDYYYLFSKNKNDENLLNISKESNALNKRKLDSTLNRLPQKITFKEIRTIDTSKGNIQHYMSTFKNAENFVMVNGWAFIANTASNKGDSIFVVLDGKNKFFIANTIPFKRPDITSHFKRSYLDDAGYYATIFCDSVDAGSYQLGLAIKNTKGQIFYQATDKSVKIKVREYPTLEKIVTLPQSADIQWGLDYLTTDSNLLKISGWAAFKNQDAANSEIKLVFKNGNQIFLCPTNPILRPDVTAHFRNKYKLDKTGFEAKILKSSLSKGKYQVGLLINDVKRSKQGVVFIDKDIEIL
ncbi:MAG TPA: DUF6311 domain-containing protein [Flavitalea sp.]|nr:DUF6311 domain-containing protein [Flavitalea sp.]